MNDLHVIDLNNFVYDLSFLCGLEACLKLPALKLTTVHTHTSLFIGYVLFGSSPRQDCAIAQNNNNNEEI